MAASNVALADAGEFVAAQPSSFANWGRTVKSFWRSLMVAAIAAGLAPSAMVAQAAEPTRVGRDQVPAAVVHDVALQPGAALRGQVLNPQGQPVLTEVRLLQQSQVVARVSTQADGRFEFTGVRGGVYLVESPEASGLVRLWTANAAPPTSREGVLLVSGPQIVQRGQTGNHLFGKAALIIGTSVAIGVGVNEVIENHRNSSISNVGAS